MDSVTRRVLHIGKFFYPSHGGIETFMYDLCEACHRRASTQAVLVHCDKDQRGGHSDLADFPFLTRFERVHQLGRVAYAPISPSFGRSLDNMIEDFHPEIIHLHLPNPSAFWVLFSKKARNIPWVIHWHADAYSPDFDTIVRLFYPLYRPLETQLLKRAKRILVSSPPYLQSSPALQRWQEKCSVIPLGLPAKRLECIISTQASGLWPSDKKSETQTALRPLKVLAVGRLTNYKGFQYLIQAIAMADAELVIAGQGDELAKLRALIAKTKNLDRVCLVTEVPDLIRNALLMECDLVCLPSINRAEAFGITVLEAMALGKPAIVSNIPGSGLPWLVEDNITGWHVPPKDPEAIAATLQGLALDRDRLSSAGRLSQERFRNHFDIDDVARQVLSAYEDLGPPRTQIT